MEINRKKQAKKKEFSTLEGTIFSAINTRQGEVVHHPHGLSIHFLGSIARFE